MERISDIREGLSRLAVGTNAIRDDPDFEWRAEGEIRAIASPTSDSAEVPKGIDASGEGEDIDNATVPDVAVVVEIAPDIDIDRSRPLLGQDKAEAIRSRTRLTGLDALGWYVPFHQTKYQWGIYVNLSGILFLGTYFQSKGASPEKAIELGAIAIIRHELLHFSTEYMISQLELSSGLECYWPSRELKDPKLRYHIREERTANAYMLRGFRHPKKAVRLRGALDVLREFTLSQPSGYNEGYLHVSRSLIERQMSEMAYEYARTIVFSYKMPPRGLDFLSLYAGIDPIDLRQCPMFLVVDDLSSPLTGISVRLISCISAIKETERFVKALSKLPIIVSNQWVKTKEKLAISAQIPGLDFKKWKDDAWSVRVNQEVRAHLRNVNGVWNAEAIGHHKEMGHG